MGPNLVSAGQGCVTHSRGTPQRSTSPHPRAKRGMALWGPGEAAQDGEGPSLCSWAHDGLRDGGARRSLRETWPQGLQLGWAQGRPPRSLHSPVAPYCPTGGPCLLPRVPGGGRDRKEGKPGRWPPSVAFLPLGQPLEAPERTGTRAVSIPSPCHSPGVTAEICPHVPTCHSPPADAALGSGHAALGGTPLAPHSAQPGAAAPPSPKAPGFPGALGGQGVCWSARALAGRALRPPQHKTARW